jgi:outer membrane receptor for ferrienterochelin and colicins
MLYTFFLKKTGIKMKSLFIRTAIFVALFSFISIAVFGFPADNPPSGRFITGKIIDASTKEPLLGANVLIKNTTLGSTTNDEGIFVITNLPSSEMTLVITMVGYKPIEAKAKQNSDPENLVFELKQAMIEMGSVVVTGTNSIHLYENASVKTEIIPKKLIQQQSACNLAQALGLQTGVMVENDCNNCNFMQVRILGFDGKYSQLLIDGDPVISSLGGVYGLEHYPQEMIEQIEIVKGGGSALYGGGAIAGTINMMTRRPYADRTKISYSGSSADGTYDQQVSAIAEIVSEDNNAGFYVYGSTRDRNDYDRNGDGYTELGRLKNETIGFNGFIKPFESSELQLSFHRIFEERRGGSGGDTLERPAHEASIAEMVKHYKWGGKVKWIHKLSPVFEYKINYAFSLLERNSYYGGLAGTSDEARLDALNYYGYSDNPLHTGGIQFNYYLGSNSLTAGVQYDHDKLLDKSVSSAAYYLDETFKNLGIYLQDEISLDEKDNTQIVAGVRFDDHSSLEDWIVSPRINIKHKLFDGLSLRAGLTTGFKAPQIFDEDLHICGLEGTQRVIRNSNGLKEERSTSYTIGAEFQDFIGDIPVLIGLTGFYTKLTDAYSEEFISSNGTIEYWERINSSGADAKGIEVDFGIKPVSPLEIRTGFTFKENKYKDEIADYNTKEFLRTPDVFGYLRVSYEVTSSLNAFFAMKYTGSMYVPHEVVVDYQEDPLLVLTESDEFIEFDLSLTQKIKLFDDVTSSVSIGVKNLTDAYQDDLDFGITRDPGYVYGPSQPRTFFFSVDLSL